MKVYLHANQSYWFNISQDIGTDPPSIICLYQTPDLDRKFRKLNSRELSRIGIEHTAKGEHEVYFGDGVIFISPTKSRILSRSSSQKQNFIKAWGDAIVQRFRSTTKSKLIHSLSNYSSLDSTDTVISAFRDYTFFDAYSVWLFNEITNTFTRIAGDLPTLSNFVEKSECDILSEAINTNVIICRNINSIQKVPDRMRPELTWVNVFSVDTTRTGMEPSIRVVVCMYSIHDNYNLRKETVDLIGSFVQQNLAHRYLDRMLRLNNLRAQIGRNLSLDSPSKFLETIVKSVITDLLWESCSLFVLDSFDESILRLMAIYPKPHNLKLINRQSYSISSNSLTSQVFQQNKMLWSYDIDKETRNTHMFNDLTETKPRDWIGVPIAIPGSSPVGVLSVKNRKSADPDRGLLFSKFDMQNIQTVAVDIASILHQYELFSKRKKLADQKAREVREMEDFIKTFRHEIRSPIQAVCYAPERIGVILREEGLITNRSIPKKLREYLLDFKATGNRMEMISKALTLNPDEIVREFKIHNIYKECVAPVFAFCIPYASKKRKYIDVDKDSLFFNMLCDAFALQMAFHVLIDNAIKYSDTNTIINVYGKPIKSGHQVVVESRSKIFSISNEDAKRIKNKYVRGKLPREQKLEGSGIGLFLADRIMELHGGSLELLKKKSPVRFALRLKI